jgi:methionyl-tRNA synthetase
MNLDKNFYITTTLPYVNSDPHVGFATELIRADVIARYKKNLGFDVFFNTGTDEHGLKLFLSAKENNMSVQEYVDLYALKFKGLVSILGISPEINFIRTTDEKHIKSAQAFWKKVMGNGYIYKKNYKTKYCIGCESEKTESELVEGKCPLHTNREIEIIEEENYFFKFSAFQEKLLNFFEKNPNFVVPDFRLNEMREFVKRGLDDFSISRLKTKMPWGIEVPDDNDHVMYVWFDALVNYISTLDWPNDSLKFEKYWLNGTPTQYCGKDNTRFQAVMWQAMLLAADLPNSHQIIVDGFITGEGGIKMSKSLGNSVNPYEIVDEFGTDALRYFVLRELHPFEDSPFTLEKFKELYNANLANGLGNLVSRVMKMSEDYSVSVSESELDLKINNQENFEKAISDFDLKKAMDILWANIGEVNLFIQEEKPFIVAKQDIETAREMTKKYVMRIWAIAKNLESFLPETSQKIQTAILENKKPEQSLFDRK